MRIGIISTVNARGWAGSEEMWRLIALEALRAGHSAAIVANPSICASPELAELGQLERLPLEPLNWVQRRLASRGAYSRFGKLKRWAPDLLMVSLGGPADMYLQHDFMAFLAEINISKVFVLQANADWLIEGHEQRIALRNLYRNAVRVICVCQSNARLLERQLAVSLPNLVVITNPYRSQSLKQLPWPVGKTMKFATVARYEVNCKCQDQTLEAFTAPPWKERDWQLDLFGKGRDEAYLKDLVKHYKLDGRVTIRGYVRDIKEIWGDHHMHILNSRQEGLTLALIESMFCGRPAIITRAGGNHELVRDGVDGFVSPGMDPEIIGETLERAWANQDKWRAMGESAFERVSSWVPADLGSQLLDAVLAKGRRENLATTSQLS